MIYALANEDAKNENCGGSQMVSVLVVEDNKNLKNVNV